MDTYFHLLTLADDVAMNMRGQVSELSAFLNLVFPKYWGWMCGWRNAEQSNPLSPALYGTVLGGTLGSVAEVSALIVL